MRQPKKAHTQKVRGALPLLKAWQAGSQHIHTGTASQLAGTHGARQTARPSSRNNLKQKERPASESASALVRGCFNTCRRKQRLRTRANQPTPRGTRTHMTQLRTSARFWRILKPSCEALHQEQAASAHGLNRQRPTRRTTIRTIMKKQKIHI